MPEAKILRELKRFARERDWEQFHSPENLAKSISIEAGELLECFQWSAETDSARIVDELADVLTYCYLMANALGVDAEVIVAKKLEITREKYPIEKSRGRALNMTGFEVLEVEFAEDRFLARDQVRAWATIDSRFSNWPVVYTLDGMGQIYIGESLNVAARFRQHHDSPTKVGLSRARVIIDDTFNKSACLDLESFLIRLFAGDGKYAVLNGNDGITDSDYYNREGYRATFSDVFDILRNEGFFNQSIREIENSDLFKLSPFKALSEDQLTAVNDIVKGLFEDIEEKRGARSWCKARPVPVKRSWQSISSNCCVISATSMLASPSTRILSWTTSPLRRLQKGSRISA